MEAVFRKQARDLGTHQGQQSQTLPGLYEEKKEVDKIILTYFFNQFFLNLVLDMNEY